jgi:hypothetical protein
MNRCISGSEGSKTAPIRVHSPLANLAVLHRKVRPFSTCAALSLSSDGAVIEGPDHQSPRRVAVRLLYASTASKARRDVSEFGMWLRMSSFG